MRKYIIKDANGSKIWGYLYYYDHQNRFKVVFREDIDVKKEKPPLFVYAYIVNGIFELNKADSLEWVQNRLIPPDRQNIDSILKAANLTFYREIDMLELCQGRCTYDKMFLEKC